MLQWKTVFAHAQPARTGTYEHAPSLAKNFLAHSIQANIPSLIRKKSQIPLSHCHPRVKNCFKYIDGSEGV